MAWDTVQELVGTAQQQAQNQGQQTAASSVSNANQYTQGQGGLQGQVASGYTGLRGGNIPTSFTAPQAVIDNYKNIFDTWTEPKLALAGGAGGPMIEANRAMGLSNLLAQLYNTGVGNYTQALGGATAAGFTPTGTMGETQSSSATSGLENLNRQYNQQTNKQYDVLGRLLSIIGDLQQGGS